MPKNKNSLNAFYHFMVDWKKQEELKGRTFPRGLRDVQANANCNEAWKNLPPKDKNFYKEKERNSRDQMKINKKTSLGESIEEVEKSQLYDAIFMDEMNTSISTIIAEADRSKCIEKLKFHVIHINYLYSRLCNNDIVYYPAEIGIAEFSLKEGITRMYHKIVCSKVEIGYASAALDHSRSTHQIPRDFGERDYGVVYKEIKNFLEPSRCGDKLPPLYTLYNKEDVKFPVMSGLELLASFHEDVSDNLVIYSFEELFVNLRNINIEDDDDLTKFNNLIVSVKLTEDPFDYRKNLACEFHQISGGENYCSKAIVQRWIFVLFSLTCPLFDIDLIPGFHAPVKNENIKDVTLLNYSLEKMNIARNQVSSAHESKHPSERTRADEEKRRSEGMAHPVLIVDHSEQYRLENVSTASQRPLDSPFTKPITSYTDNCVEIVYDESDFPSIGRGSRIQNRKAITSNTDNSVEIIYDESDFPSIGRGSRIRSQKAITSYTDNCVEIIYDESDFPSIGRGSSIRSRGGNISRNKISK